MRVPPLSDPGEARTGPRLRRLPPERRGRLLDETILLKAPGRSLPNQSRPGFFSRRPVEPAVRTFFRQRRDRQSGFRWRRRPTSPPPPPPWLPSILWRRGQAASGPLPAFCGSWCAGAGRGYASRNTAPWCPDSFPGRPDRQRVPACQALDSASGANLPPMPGCCGPLMLSPPLRAKHDPGPVLSLLSFIFIVELKTRSSEPIFGESSFSVSPLPSSCLLGSSWKPVCPAVSPRNRFPL